MNSRSLSGIQNVANGDTLRPEDAAQVAQHAHPQPQAERHAAALRDGRAELPALRLEQADAGADQVRDFLEAEHRLRTGDARTREQAERRGDCIGPKSNFRSPGPVQDEAMDAPSDRPDWHRYHALREQWVHEDDLVHYRMVWLILSQGLLLNAYGTLPLADVRWIALGVPFFGLALAALIGAGIFAALASAADIGRRYAEAGGPGIPGLAPDRRLRARGDWATRALPFIFGALWLLALVAALGS